MLGESYDKFVAFKDDRLEEGTKLWKVDPEGCLLISDEEPTNVINVGSLTSIKPDAV